MFSKVTYLLNDLSESISDQVRHHNEGILMYDEITIPVLAVTRWVRTWRRTAKEEIGIC